MHVRYSALILADDDVPITAEKLNTILKAANVTVECIWPTLFARALSACNIKDLINNVAVALLRRLLQLALVLLQQRRPRRETRSRKRRKRKQTLKMGFGLFD